MSDTAESGQFRLKVWGENACFTRPEMKVERVSYDVMTPSAARSIMEAILWKPAIQWIIDKIDVLNPIQWESCRRNELGNVMSPRTPGIYIEDYRQQRASLLLRDVAYTIHAHFRMTKRAGPSDSVTKFQEMFLRRADKGQCFNTPYLGCREFSASFELIPMGRELPSPIKENRDLGWMLQDIDFSVDPPQPKFFRAQMLAGTIEVPPLTEARQ
jgi:CRISPR-associated protein Cas5d